MTDHYTIGLEKLQGTKTRRVVQYFAHEINRYVTVNAIDVERLGAMVAAGVDDAYSLWCAETPSAACQVWARREEEHR